MEKICWWVFLCIMIVYLVISNYTDGEYFYACVDSVALGLSIAIVIEEICDYCKKKLKK